MLRTASSLPLYRASDAGLRPGPFPGRAASLLPGLLAATRTGLPPAGDDELTNTKKHHGTTSRCHLPFCWARDCGSNGVSGPITPGVMAWRERCRDDRDTGQCGSEEEGQAGADCGAEAGRGAGGPGPGAGRVADGPGWAAEAADQDGAGDGAESGDDRASRS